MRDIPARAEDMVDETRSTLDSTMETISEKARYAARFADRRVHANPWTAVGVGFAAGMVFGALLTAAVGAQRSTFSRMM